MAPFPTSGACALVFWERFEQHHYFTFENRNGLLAVFLFRAVLQCATRWGLFLIFAGCTAAGSLALWLLVPETKGLPIEEVHLAWASHWFWAHTSVKQRALSGCLFTATTTTPEVATTQQSSDKVSAVVHGGAAVTAGGSGGGVQAPQGCCVHVRIDVALPATAAAGACGGKL